MGPMVIDGAVRAAIRSSARSELVARIKHSNSRRNRSDGSVAELTILRNIVHALGTAQSSRAGVTVVSLNWHRRACTRRSWTHRGSAMMWNLSARVSHLDVPRMTEYIVSPLEIRHTTSGFVRRPATPTAGVTWSPFQATLYRWLPGHGCHMKGIHVQRAKERPRTE